MSPRLAKEFRPLLLPWSVAALAAAGHLVALANPVFAKGEFGSFLIGLAGVTFVVGVLVLAAMPIAVELQDRTLALFFTQPVERMQLWREKLMAGTLAVVALAVVHGLAYAVAGQLSWPAGFTGAAFVVTAICSVGYFTLSARSLLIGIVAAAGTPYAIAGGIFLIVYYVLGLHIELSEQAWIAVLLGACAVYSAVLLRSSRRQFAELELKEGTISRAAEIPAAITPKRITAAFRCRPGGVVANLVRKEVCLQKPMFLVSAVFTTAWIITLALMVLCPAWHTNLVAVFHGLTGTQVVLMVMLTGCVALGDDKALGTAAWHLTLPVSARRQWAIKLLVGAGTIVATAVVLPTGLAVLTLFKARVGLLALSPHALAFVIPCAFVFVLSFWSASMVNSTVRAVFTCILALICLLACVSLGAGAPEAFFISSPRNSPGLQSGLITSLIARYQLPPNFFADHDGTIPYSIVVVVLIVALTMLAQSLAQFRRAQTQRAVLLKYSVILAVIVLTGSFWCADLARSISRQWNSPLVADVTAALRSASLQDFELAEGSGRELTLSELEKKSSLSHRARQWLKNSTINVRRVASRSRHFANARIYSAEVNLPNGMIVPFSWTVPDAESDSEPKKRL